MKCGPRRSISLEILIMTTFQSVVINACIFLVRVPWSNFRIIGNLAELFARQVQLPRHTFARSSH